MVFLKKRYFFADFLPQVLVGLGIGVCAHGAHGQSSLPSSSVQVNLSSYSPTTNFQVSAGVVINSLGNEGIHGDISNTWEVTNNGSVSGLARGIWFAGNGQVENYGVISGAGPLSGSGGGGLVIRNVGQVKNMAGATIDGTNSDGVFLGGAGSTLLNEGTIETGLTAAYFANGGSFTQTNSGKLLGHAGKTTYGVIGNSGTLTGTNAGEIDVSGRAVWYRGATAGTFLNSGTMQGGTGVYLDSSGLVEITNQGTITGTGGLAIDIRTSNNTIILDTGSILNGDGVVTVGTTNNQLILRGTAQEDSNLTGFSTLDMQGSLWELSGNVTTTQNSSSATTVSSGTLVISGQLSNTGGALAGTQINPGAFLQIGNGGTTGDVIGPMNNNGTLIFNRSDTYTYATPITGIGEVIQAGSGTTVLQAANTYSGTTTIQNGTLSPGMANTLSSASNHIIGAGGRLDLVGHDQTIARLENSGQVILGQAAPGTTLQVTGDYLGHNGLMTFNTTLDGNGSATDLMSVGGNVSGHTQVIIRNIGGSGVQTTGDGIEIVRVQGTSSSNAFALSAPVTSGAYEYVLGQGSGSNSESWFLRNYIPALVPPVIPPTNPPLPVAPGGERQYLLNPNAGAYVGNQYMAGNLFYHHLLDRRESISNVEQTLWVRIKNTDTESHLFDSKQHMNADAQIVQLGADLVRRENMLAGIYAGYGRSNIDNTSLQTGSTASGQVDGYQLGVYASWLPQEHIGPYVDLWAYYAWFNNQLSGQSQFWKTSYDSTGWAVSAEAGYGIGLWAQPDGRSWILKPHAQLSYVNIKTDSFYDSHETHYSSNKNHGYIARLGTRLYGYTPSSSEQMNVTPFIEVNWLHQSSDNTVRLNGTQLQSDIAKNIGEIKLGAQGYLTPSLNVWGHIGYQHGSGHYRRHEIQLGFGWNW